MKRALITGITGQDGAYLAQLLLSKGYDVVGGRRHRSSPHNWRLTELGIADDIRFVNFELCDDSSMKALIHAVEPDEVYNLAAESFVPLSFEQPAYVGEVNGLGVARLLEAIRTVNPAIRFYQASTSELFGEKGEGKQSETTPMHPRNPYGVAKLYAHRLVANYREAYGLHATAGILFNHESPLRGIEFVTRKISLAFARMAMGQQDMLSLGNIDARRDWGFAGDYVEAMWMMLQQPEPDDYVIATGESHSVADFVVHASRAAGTEIEWAGHGPDCCGLSTRSGEVVVSITGDLYRPSDVEALEGDAAKAHRVLGWSPDTSFAKLAEMMVAADLERLKA